MKRTFIQILTWVGILFGGMVVSAMIWMLLFHGSTTIDSQKWLQFISIVGTFLLPPLICGSLWHEEHKPFRWLQMRQGTHWKHFLWAIGIMIAALPAINLLADLNSRIPLPDSLLQSEKEAEETIRAFLKADNFGAVMLNIGLLALLPAFAEEMTFRGTLQQVLSGDKLRSYKIHLAIWITAITFSAIHMQFLGFIPRMLMGALFGYTFVWTGTLWIPIVMHFTNNAISIGLYYVMPENSNADTFGAGTTWWVGILSLTITCLGLLIFYRRTHKQ